ncbi:hypothetical protein [Streptomyces sp. NPDC004296]|uniref:hypothetical protein n=1 Tax=Streptomyces sp. NPDC004296 TaxID=3364697 RepID=UPI0036C93EB6
MVTGAGPGGAPAQGPAAEGVTEGATEGTAMSVGRLPVPPVWPLPPVPGWDEAAESVA